ncbi:hypothetical protein KEM56_001602 [Ascosphaera pollenicola]|nr:hypothetical protein KEM56_001602 [Ascosphaera pollenicola]
MVKLTDKIDWVAAGLIQPLAIGIQMSRQAGLKAHQTVFIAGGGCVGLLLGAIAKAYGAAKVVVVEKQAHRVEFAKRFYADVVIQNPPRPVDQNSEEYAQDFAFDVLAAVPEASRNRGFDVCIDASGAEECMQMGIELSERQE